MPARLGAYTAAHITTGTNQIATVGGTLHTITIGTSAAGTITVTDGTSTITGTTIAVITALASGAPVTLAFDCTFGNGLKVVLSATMDVTVAYV